MFQGKKLAACCLLRHVLTALPRPPIHCSASCARFNHVCRPRIEDDLIVIACLVQLIALISSNGQVNTILAEILHGKAAALSLHREQIEKQVSILPMRDSQLIEPVPQNSSGCIPINLHSDNQACLSIAVLEPLNTTTTCNNNACFPASITVEHTVMHSRHPHPAIRTVLQPYSQGCHQRECNAQRWSTDAVSWTLKHDANTDCWKKRS